MEILVEVKMALVWPLKGLELGLDLRIDRILMSLMM